MNKIKWLLSGSFVVFLSACTSTSSLTQLEVPTQITHNDKSFSLKGSQDLGTIARYVYLPDNESLENWQSEIEILFDRNPDYQSIKSRIALRERIYQHNGVKYFKLGQQDNALISTVIYEPSEQNNDWQVNVAKGKNIAHCGFIQYQFSQKVVIQNKNSRLKPEKMLKHLRKYVADKQGQILKNMPWTLKCQKSD